MIRNRRKIWYFGLEPLKERYTYQLSEVWMPKTFEKYDVDFLSIRPQAGVDNEIKNGAVLDATGRGIYSMYQCQAFLGCLEKGLVKQDDIIFLQDFWTPGFESILYALDLYGIKVKIYSMLHAQSVDEYDFTYQMKSWMRHFELGLDKVHSGIFVGSTIHRDQLRAAGFESPIHVVGLPIHKEFVADEFEPIEKKNQVVFTSRLDKEKNPFFLLEVAKRFLKEKRDWEFVITTSGKSLRSSIPDVPDILKEYAMKESRFIIREGLSKSGYYHILQESKIQFNCSLQDYVSWTLLEALYWNCHLVYPNFRSFPELLQSDQMYEAFDLNSAVSKLVATSEKPVKNQYKRPLDLSDLGRRFEAYIMLNDETREFNIWHESEFIKKLLEE